MARSSLGMLAGVVAAVALLLVLAGCAVAPVSALQNEAVVRAALCDFYSAASAAPGWTHSEGWCNATTPVCTWYGLGCDASEDFVTKVLLDATGLDLVDPSSNINALWGVLGSELLELDLSGNRYLGLLDLTPLTGLTTLTLSGFNQPQGAVTPPLPTSVTLPSPFSALTFLDVHSSGLMVDLSRTPQLKELHAAGNYAPWNLADIWKAPALQIVDFVASAVSTSTAVGSLSGAALTKDVLSRLGSTNPALETLLLSSTTHLDFGDAAADTLYGSNVPVVKSPSLRTLGLSQLSQLSALKGIDPMLLAYLPALEELLLSGAPNVCINISSVAPNAASSSISTLQFAGTCLRGDLSVLSSSRFSKLSVLSADDSGLGGSLPPNVAAVWPELKTLSLARNGLEGSMTSFADLPNLAFLKLTSNKITGRLPTNFLENSLAITDVYLEDNQLSGPLPPLSSGLQFLVTLNLQGNSLTGPWPSTSWQGLSALRQLNLANNPLNCTLPSNAWDSLPSLYTVDASYAGLSGSIPSASTLRFFGHFAFVGNEFTGSLPTNVTGEHIDLSSNELSGPVFFATPPSPSTQHVMYVHLAHNRALTCPIDLSAHTMLQHLEIQNSGFDGCDFASNTDVRLPTSASPSSAILHYLDVSHNGWKSPFHLAVPPTLQTLLAVQAGVTSFGPAGDESANTYALQVLHLDDARLTLAAQIRSLDSLITFAATLTEFSCARCGLALSTTQLSPSFSASNKRSALNRALQRVNLAGNDLHGELQSTSFQWAVPEASSDGFIMTWPLTLETLDLSDNPRLVGPLPPARLGYSRLHTLDLSGTSLTGPIPESWSNFVSLASLDLTGTELSCDLRADGKGGVECVLPSWIHATPTMQMLVPNSTTQLVPGIRCPQLVAASGRLSKFQIDPKYHARTLCQCAEGWFGKDGRCVQCPKACRCFGDLIEECFPTMQPIKEQGHDEHHEIELALPLEITALSVCPRTLTGEAQCNPRVEPFPLFYLFPAGLNGYNASERVAQGTMGRIDVATALQDGWCADGYKGRLCSACEEGYFASGRECSKCGTQGAHVVLLLVCLVLFALLLLFLYWQAAPSRLRVESSSTKGGGRSNLYATGGSPAINALRLLVFHSQQLSLLLFTNTSIPAELAGFFAFLFATSTGFSFSNLVALDCLGSGWTVTTRAWMALLAPLLVAFVALGAWIAGRNASAATHADDALTKPSRLLAACAVMMQLLSFPCALTILSAISCRTAPTSLKIRALADDTWLNMHPAIQCDANWRSHTVPPAAIGVVVWFVVYPLLSAWTSFRMRKSMQGSALTQGTPSPAAATLLGAYVSRVWYWEQILLARRYLLILCVCLVPTDSVYLPMAFLALVQASLLLEHYGLPYRSAWMHLAELLSLYLLLINYLSAVIFQAVASALSPAAGSIRTWGALLFLLNLVFFIILLLAHISFVRSLSVALLSRLRCVLDALGCVVGTDERFERLGDHDDGLDTAVLSNQHGSSTGGSGNGSTAAASDDEHQVQKNGRLQENHARASLGGANPADVEVELR